MKDASPELIAFLQNNSTFLMADCFTFILANGQTLCYTTADVDIILDGIVFAAHSVLVKGLKYKISIGVSVDEQDITISARPDDLVNGVPFLVAMRTGVFRGSYLKRQRAFLSSWTAPAIGGVTLFHGRMSTVGKIGDTTAQAKVKSDMLILNQAFPRNGYQPSCLWVFCSAQCGVSKAAITVAGIAGGGTYSTVQWGGAVAGQFDQGTILFQTGANAGVSANIKHSDGATLYLSYPLEYEVAEGDNFKATPGCAHDIASCTSFNNLANFRGFPFVPPPETAY
jgi:uncharacterized phage protein (TIGR02218 family)